MAAATLSNGSNDSSTGGNGPTPERTSLMDASKALHIDEDIGETKLVQNGRESMPKVVGPSEDSVMASSTPRASFKRTPSGDLEEQPATSSPLSETVIKSVDASPQQSSVVDHQPLVSHVPEAVKQPILQASSEQSSLASSAPRMDGGDNIAQQQQQQQQNLGAGATPVTVIHGTQGHVVAKQKGRFRLLQNSPIMEAGASETTGSSSGGGRQGAHMDGGINAPVIASTPLMDEAAVPPTHPTREQSLSNTSTLSGTSERAGQVPVAALPASGMSAVSPLSADQPPQAAAAVKKKGRFVVLPGDDQPLLVQGAKENVLVRQITPTGQPIAGQPQPQHDSLALESVQASTTQSVQSVVSAPAPLVTMTNAHQQRHFTRGSEQPQQAYQTSTGVPQLVANQINPFHYYQPAPETQLSAVPVVPAQAPVAQPQSHCSFGSVQAVHASYSHQPQPLGQSQPQVQVGAPQMGQPTFQQQHAAPRTQPMISYALAPQSAQSIQANSMMHQHLPQPSAQILVPAPFLPQPTFLQTEEGRPQKVAISSDSTVASGMGQHALSHEAVPPIHPPLPAHSGAMVAQTASGDAVKTAPPSTKGSAQAAKRPPGGKGAQANVGFGKVLYFLDQMKQEVTEADRTVKDQAKDMKFLREKNKELEARSRDMEKKWLEEKSAREALEAKVRSLKKKMKELKGSIEANNVDDIEDVGDKVSEPAELARPDPQSRNDSMDGADIINGKAGAAVNQTHVGTGVEPHGVELSSGQGEARRELSTIDGTPAEHGPTVSSAPAESSMHNTTADKRGGEPTTRANSPAPKGVVSVEEGLVRRSSNGDLVNEEHSSKAKSVSENTPASSERSHTSHFISEETTWSPPRRRHSKDATADKLGREQSLSVRSLSGGSTTQATYGSGQVSARPHGTSSSDSLGSSSEFDPLRVVASNPSGAITDLHGQTTLPPSHAVLPPDVEFDPLRVSHAKELPIASSMPHHIQSQSMPDFILHQNHMAMLHSVQQIDMQMTGSGSAPHPMQQQAWQFQQQHVTSVQNVPIQYEVVTQQQQPVQHQHQSYQPSDPFDELASRRAPGNT